MVDGACDERHRQHDHGDRDLEQDARPEAHAGRLWLWLRPWRWLVLRHPTSRLRRSSSCVTRCDDTAYILRRRPDDGQQEARCSRWASTTFLATRSSVSRIVVRLTPRPIATFGWLAGVPTGVPPGLIEPKGCRVVARDQRRRACPGKVGWGPVCGSTCRARQKTRRELRGAQRSTVVAPRGRRFCKRRGFGGAVGGAVRRRWCAYSRSGPGIRGRGGGPVRPVLSSRARTMKSRPDSADRTPFFGPGGVAPVSWTRRVRVRRLVGFGC
jgi:hypothetical protein